MPPVDNQTNTKELIHWAVNASFAVIFTGLGFILNMAFDDIDKLEVNASLAPRTYVLKEDYRDDQNKLLAALAGLGTKIEHSAEYMEADYNRRMDKIEELLKAPRP